jgi:hypothetical protein
MSSCRTAAVVACRVLGLYVAIQSLGLLPVWALGSSRDISSLWVLPSLAVLMAVPIGLAVVSWTLAPWIADKMLTDVEHGQTPSPITVEDAQAVAVSILGLLFVLESIPGIVVNLLDYLRWSTEGYHLSPPLAETGITSVTRAAAMNATKVALGLWLLFGARSFARVLQRFCAPHAD